MIELDFIPEEHHLERRRSMALWRNLAGLGLIGLAMIVWTADNARQRRSVGAQLNVLARTAAQLDGLLDARERMLAERAKLIECATIAESLKALPTYQEVIYEISRRMPDSLGIVELRLETTDYWDNPTPGDRANTPPSQRGVVPKAGPSGMAVVPMDGGKTCLRINGWAASDSDLGSFMSGLGDHPEFDDIKLHHSRPEVVEGKLTRRFELSLTVRLSQPEGEIL